MSRPRVFFGLAVGFAGIAAASAAKPLHAYGPGGPYPAMKEAAETFGKAHGVDVQVTAVTRREMLRSWRYRQGDRYSIAIDKPAVF